MKFVLPDNRKGWSTVLRDVVDDGLLINLFVSWVSAFADKEVCDLDIEVFIRNECGMKDQGSTFDVFVW